ncbi:NAD-dependent succinate-semialdehyde dehydrogenase [Deinococcus peraridilitoris]|uniref:NAD-dependent aldehyde dehydrogenase n=1 Tax=Deinococcus peraridilitoris (strain DSM 19664 / LMG 22246 / CIP 109416 / KR-200) TaxID=937777 RepID=L0A7B0_DEIPD|nr:NAD-dependent succinate-semialdehyde dehydrogenase [Deinococcus peraridilitoris]AFZ69334.1 NAD-dependent aldehyde dehydrogenase [Deinococcus peraridilitoris DSM 19664]
MNTAIINGQPHQAHTSFSVTNPATFQVIAEVSDCGPEEAARAIDAAAEAFTRWRRTTAYERAQLLMAWRERILADQSNLARIMTSEMGKPIKESEGEIAFSTTFLEYYAGEAKRIPGSLVPSQFANKRLMVTSEPVGIVYAVTPWNFPASMVARKVAPALAAGCCFILKPADRSPLTALRLAELWHEVGGPQGVFQVLPTSNAAALSEVMMQDARVRKLTFTGSTPVGRLLAQQSAATLKRVSLELGGHAPLVVFEDADIDLAVEGTIASKYRNAGQTCVCANRIYVHADIMSEFSRRFTQRVEQLVVGDPMERTTDIGPLVAAEAVEKAERHVEDALSLGATLTTGGNRPNRTGHYFTPTVLQGVPASALITREETFGPVAPLIPFEREADIITLANTSDYGLAAYFWTHNLDRVFRISEALEYGLIGVNDPLPSTAQGPFGGVKQSGYGREGGSWGLDEYMSTKFVSIGIKL